MIKLYYHPSPNPAKVALFLEEAGLPYEVVPVDTRKGEQFEPAYGAVNPNGKVPAIIDGDVTVFDSNAILLYLAGKTGQFLPEGEPVRGEIYVVKMISSRMEYGYVLRFVQLRANFYTFGGSDERGGWRPNPEPSVGWMMHFRLIRPRPAPRGSATMEDAARNVSTWTLCDGPLQTDGMRRYIVGRVIGVVLREGVS